MGDAETDSTGSSNLDGSGGLESSGALESSGIDNFSDPERNAVYRAIYERRDMRHFRSDPIPDDALARIIQAAHHGPSVGFMQPWDFIVIKDAQVRGQIKELFDRERQAASCFFDEPRRTQYLSLKLEGILEAPIGVCVTCDSTRAEEVLGRNAVPEADVYSTCCAIQNLWLAARCEGIGVGWVSILKTRQLRQILGIPAHISPVAFLCLGYPTQFYEKPMLEQEGWRSRQPVDPLIHLDGWSGQSGPEWDAFLEELGRVPQAETGSN